MIMDSSTVLDPLTTRPSAEIEEPGITCEKVREQDCLGTGRREDRHLQNVTLLNEVDVNGFFAFNIIISIHFDQYGRLGSQLEQAGDGLRGPSFGHELEIFTEEDDRNEHRRHVKKRDS